MVMLVKMYVVLDDDDDDDDEDRGDHGGHHDDGDHDDHDDSNNNGDDDGHSTISKATELSFELPPDYNQTTTKLQSTVKTGPSVAIFYLEITDSIKDSTWTHLTWELVP